MTPAKRSRPALWLACEEGNQLVVCRRELERGQRFAGDPPHFLVQLRNGFSEKLAGEEVQLDAPFRVLVAGGQDFRSHRRVDRKLFPKLAPETCGERLPCIAFATRKLPVALEV